MQDQIKRFYQIDAESEDEAFLGILKFCHDIAFYIPTVALATAWQQQSGSAYLYHFNEPNPWEGMWKGVASHITDVAFLWQNFNQFLTSSQQAVGRQFATDVIAFVNGEAPWQPFESEEGKPTTRVYGPSDHDIVATTTAEKTEETGRRPVIWDLIGSVSADRLLAVVHSFLAGS